MAVLDRNAILGAKDLPSETVDVPEWGGQVIVRTLTGEERDQYESSMIDIVGEGSRRQAVPNMENLRATLCALTIVDDEGERLFTTDDIIELGHKSASALDKIFEVARRLSGLSEADIEELAQGLEPTPSVGTLSS